MLKRVSKGRGLKRGKEDKSAFSPSILRNGSLNFFLNDRFVMKTTTKKRKTKRSFFNGYSKRGGERKPT